MTVAPHIAEEGPAEIPLAPETLLPGQYFGALVGESRRRPEHRLMLAVIEEALSTFHRHVDSRSQRSRRLVGDVETWLGATLDDGPFSFVAICAALDLHEDGLRRGIERWAAEQRRRVAVGGRPRYWNPFRKVPFGGRRLAAGRVATSKSA